MMHATHSSNHLKILLIEDSKGDALIISKVLHQALPDLHTLEITTTIKEALKIVAAKDFDVALLDRTLPDAREFNGLHSLQNLSPKLPIIFLTGYKDECIALEAIKQGAQDYLFKDQLDAVYIKRAIEYAIQRKQFEEILITRAHFDMLTGLANRTLFENRLHATLNRINQLGGTISVLLLDLDKFKSVNDTLGHLAGDKLLKEIGYRMKHSLRTYDLAARIGGDEFAILLENLTKSEQSEIIAQKLIQAIGMPFNLSGTIISVEVSIGIINYSGAHELSGEQLFQRVDSALYRAKSIPGSAYHVYESQTV